MLNKIQESLQKNGFKKTAELAFKKLFPNLTYLMEKQRFYHCVRNRKPYFGEYMAARQGSIARHYFMKKLVKQECESNKNRLYHIAEIGSWAGGSAITWANALQEYHQAQGTVFCIDPWIPYFDPSIHKENVYERMQRNLEKGEIFNLFLHNISAAKVHPFIKILRGKSSDILPFLKENSFQLVYIDGSHAYDDVIWDIRNASKLIGEGGILCGDDLELQSMEIDLMVARDSVRKDFILDPKTKQYYHPGVTLAVADTIGPVSSWEGFWAARKTASGWEKVELRDINQNEISIPQHFKV